MQDVVCCVFYFDEQRELDIHSPPKFFNFGGGWLSSGTAQLPPFAALWVRFALNIRVDVLHNDDVPLCIWFQYDAVIHVEQFVSHALAMI